MTLVSIISTIAAGTIVIAFNDAIKDGFKAMYDYVTSLMCSQLVMEIRQTPKTWFAIKEEILKSNRSTYEVLDGIIEPLYTVANGSYGIFYSGNYINVSFDGKLVKLTVFMNTSHFLKNYVNKIYKEHCAPEKVIVFYNVKNENWSFPVFRRPRSLKNIPVTDDMKIVLKDIDEFEKSEKNYESVGQPYRMGILLEGPPGVGKSTIIEIAAMKNRNVYIINFNTKDMDDNMLINLISSVPPRSIIAFEEIEKQLSLLESIGSKISYGGILSAFDGPQRLSHGTIIILTANEFSLEKSFQNALLRKGRVDKRYKLNELLVK